MCEQYLAIVITLVFIVLSAMGSLCWLNSWARPIIVNFITLNTSECSHNCYCLMCDVGKGF